MMSCVSRSRSVVKTLHEVDPDFRDLVTMLYGPDVDADAIWRDVFGGVSKASPDSSEVSVPGSGNKVKRNIALAGTLAGAALGVNELREKIPAAVKAVKNGSGVLVPEKLITPRAAATGIGTAGLALGADAAASDELRPRKQKQTTSKAAPSVGDLSEGIQRGWKALIPTDHPVVQRLMSQTGQAGGKAKSGFKNARTGGITAKPKVGAKDSASYNLGAAAGNVANAAGANTGSKVATAGLAAYGGTKMYGRHQRNKAASDMPDGGFYNPYVGKRDDTDVVWQGEFAKFDEDKRLAFGWASVVELDGMPVIDRQGDVISPEEMEDAAYSYVLKSRKGGDMHRRTPDDAPHEVSQLVESFVVTDEKVAKMGLPEDTPRGWWVGFKIHDEDTWQMVRKGERTGFSIHGRGKRTEVPVDSVMGYA